MIAGHFTTALVAKRYTPLGPLAFYLVASQLLDLLWLLFHYLGLETTKPDNFMHVSLDALQVEMTYSHDLIPVLGWTLATALFGRMVFKSWKIGWIGGGLVFLHALMDYVGAYSHHVYGPESPNITTALYYNAPNLAVTIELLFLIAMMVWVVKLDRDAGVRRNRTTWIIWILVFIGSSALMFLTADTSLAETTGLTDVTWLAGSTVPFLAVLYLLMIIGLNWADKQPTIPVSKTTI